MGNLTNTSIPKNTKHSAREPYLDSIGGLLLLYMIVGHFALWAGLWEQFDRFTYWLGFFLPWFFFKGGMFYRQKSQKEIIKSGYHRLLIPFIWFSIIGTLILWVKYLALGDFSISNIAISVGSFFLYGSFPGDLPMWFVLSLFLVRVIFNFFHIKIKGAQSGSIRLIWQISLALSCLVFIPYHYAMNGLGFVHFPLYISNVSSGLAFYTCGYLLRDFKPNIPTTLLFSAAYLLAIIFCPIQVDMRSGNSDSSLFPLWIPYCIIAIITFNSWAKILLNRPNIMTAVGRDTMPFYCMHWCIMTAVSIFFCKSDAPNLTYFVTLICANAILLPLLTYWIKRTRYKFIFG